MKKIGKEVFMLKTSKDNPRNGEGSFLRLKDGRIMYAYTQYYGDDWTDHAIARIAACYSSDEGETWSESKILFEKPDNAQNIMSVSLFRSPTGEVGIIYLQKEIYGEILGIRTLIRRSYDECETFTEPEEISGLDRRGTNNDRVVVLKNGRILCPACLHPGSTLEYIAPGVVEMYYSDDGKTFKKSESIIRSPYDDYTQLQEPGVFELPDGRLWMYARTGYGCQFQAFSSDFGESWTEEATPNWRFTSPDSPMLVKTVGKYTLAIFNPIPFSPVNTRCEIWGSPKRTPFICAVSTDGGLSFVDMGFNSRNGDYKSFVENCYYLEDNLENSYCYPAVIEVDGGFLVAYYHSDNTDVCLNATKIIKVSFDEFTK